MSDNLYFINYCPVPCSSISFLMPFESCGSCFRHYRWTFSPKCRSEPLRSQRKKMFPTGVTVAAPDTNPSSSVPDLVLVEASVLLFVIIEGRRHWPLVIHWLFPSPHLKVRWCCCVRSLIWTSAMGQRAAGLLWVKPAQDIVSVRYLGNCWLRLMASVCGDQEH